MSPKCDACPFAGRPEACYAQGPGRGNLCRLVGRGVRGYRELVRARTVEAAPALAPSFPPIAEQARSFTVALGRFAASGFHLATAEEQARRLSICEACPHYAPGPPGRCTLCGCRARWKARLATSHCPDKPPRW